MTNTMRFGVLGLSAVGLAGCMSQQPVAMSPPVAPPPAMTAQASNGQVYNWRDVPAGQQVPISRAVFDQGGYQLYAASGETIAVPFENQNMYVMKFGRTNGSMYFVNEGNATPTLYVTEGMGLQNAAAQGAMWYPFPQNYAYTRPVYMGIAPSWGEYTSMGWYPGMHYYGGYYGYSPWRMGLAYAAMPGLYINLGGHRYDGWGSYSSYYRSNPVNRVLITNNRNSFNYSSVGRRSASSGSFSRSTGSSGSFGKSSSTRPGTGGFSSARPSGSTGSFGSGRPSGSTGGFSSARPSFGSGTSSSRPSFGGGSSSSRPSFGGGSSGFGSSSGSRTGSFGGSSSGFSSSRPSGGSSFGGGGGRSFGGGGRRR